MKEYKTIRQAATAEFVERRSRFIGYVAPVATAEEAAALIAEKKSAYWDATHNVYAYILRDGQQKRYSDDGEPQGTAGVPVLDVLQKSGLVDVCAVVTRYFGGVLLGAGGLVRAYSQGASLAVKAAQVITMSECVKLELDCAYDFYGKLARMLPAHSAKITESDFGAQVRLAFLIKENLLQAFLSELTEASAARVVPREIEKKFCCIED